MRKMAGPLWLSQGADIARVGVLLGAHPDNQGMGGFSQVQGGVRIWGPWDQATVGPARVGCIASPLSPWGCGGLAMGGRVSVRPRESIAYLLLEQPPLQTADKQHPRWGRERRNVLLLVGLHVRPGFPPARSLPCGATWALCTSLRLQGTWEHTNTPPAHGSDSSKWGQASGVRVPS